MSLIIPLPLVPWYGWTFALSLFVFGIAAYVHMHEKARARSHGGGFVRFPSTPGIHVSDEDLRDLSIGAFLSATWGFPVDTLATRHPAESTASVLRDAWDVHSGSDAKETLRWLLDTGHRTAFDATIDAAGPDLMKATSDQNSEAFGAHGAAESAEPYEHLLAAHAELRQRGFIQSGADLSRGTGAWDYSRAVTVTRFAHNSGLLTDAEAWGFIREAGARARAEFNSWEEFLRSYVIGRTMWNGLEQLDGSEISAVIADVRGGSESPWRRVSWN